MAETPFTETQALLACLNGDEDGAEQLVKSMYRSERTALANAAGLLAAICTSRCDVCDERLVIGDPRGTVHTRPFASGGGILHHATCSPLTEEAPNG